MDFAINTSDGLGTMTWDKADNFMNNIYLSLMVRKGSFFQNPEFGSRLHLLERAKNTEQTASLAVQYCKEALQWLIDIGRARTVEAYAERDRLETLERMKLLVLVTQADGRQVSFQTFVPVV